MEGKVAYNLGSLPANVAALAFRAEPVVFLFRCRYASPFQARRMDRGSAFGTGNQSLVFTLTVFLTRAETLGTEKRRRLHLH